MAEPKEMSKEQIEAKVGAKLDRYNDLDVLERYAIFMGKVQILEFGLKQLFIRRFGGSLEDIERWTLGITKNELRENGIRSDFIKYLENVVVHRNYMAHNFLVDIGITVSINDFNKRKRDFSERKLYGILNRASYELEQIIILHDWCEENDGWVME